MTPNVNFTYSDKYPAEMAILKDDLTERLLVLVEDWRAVLPRGEQIMVEMDMCDQLVPHSTTSLFSLHFIEGTSGSFAEAKMNTLRTFSDIAATGTMSLKEFLTRARPLLPEGIEMLPELYQYEEASQLLRRHHDWIKGILNLTLFPGGIRIPFTTKNGHLGEIRISFSALTAEADTCMCLKVFKCVQKALRAVQTPDWALFDLEALRKIPMIQFHILNEAPEVLLQK